MFYLKSGLAFWNSRFRNNQKEQALAVFLRSDVWPGGGGGGGQIRAN